MNYITELSVRLNARIISSSTVVIDADSELEWDAHSTEDGNTVITNYRGEILDTAKFDKLSATKNGDHQRIYSGHFRTVKVWRNEELTTEWRWERPMFVHRVENMVTLIAVDESANGMTDEDGEVWEADMDVEVMYRRLITRMQDAGYEYLAGKSHKLLFLNPGVKPEQILGRVWTEFTTGNKATDCQFIAGMLLRPGIYSEESKSLKLPMRRATAEMDGVGIVFTEKQWRQVTDYYGLDSKTCVMQVTYSNPKTGAAFKGTIAVETAGRPAGTYTETWKYLGQNIKSINLKYLSVMNSDLIVNSRSSFNQQQSYYELTPTQQERVVTDFQLALDNISDLKSLAGAGAVITAGHLISEGVNPYYGPSAQELDTIRTNMALKACRNTPVAGWMLIVQPSLDLFHDEIRVPERLYKRFLKARKAGKFARFNNKMTALMQRHPTLATGGSMQHYRVTGISKGNVIEIGMRAAQDEAANLGLAQAGKISFTQWGSFQLGDFDGDQGVIYDPFWVFERLNDFQPKRIHNQERYKPEKRKTEGTDSQTRIEMMIKEASIAIGMGDSAARQAIDNGMATEEFLQECSMHVQASITSKKYETEVQPLNKPKGMKPVNQCAFEQLKKLKAGQDVDAFADHYMLPAVVQALSIAEMTTPGAEYSTSALKNAFAQVSLMFSNAAVREALEMAAEQVNFYNVLNSARSAAVDAMVRQELSKALKQFRTVDLPLAVETQGLFAAWKPKGFIGNLTSEQDMRRALMALAVAHQLPTHLNIWAQSMDRKILELFLGERHGGAGGQEIVLLTGGIRPQQHGNQMEFVVDEFGVAYQDGNRVGRFALDKAMPEAGTRLFTVVGGTDRRIILEAI